MIAHVQSINLSTKVPPFRGTPKPRYSHARHLRRRPDPCAHRPGSHRRHHSPQPRLRKRPSNLLRPSGPPRLQPHRPWPLHPPPPRLQHPIPPSLNYHPSKNKATKPAPHTTRSTVTNHMKSWSESSLPQILPIFCSPRNT